jgi:transposase-like protein
MVEAGPQNVGHGSIRRFMSSRSIILKRGGKGRVRTPTSVKARAIEAFGRSGLSARAFAQQAGIRYHTFWSWLHNAGLTQRREQAAARQSEVRLVEVTPPPALGEALCVELPGGAQLLVRNAAQAGLAAQLLKALA